MGRVKDQHNVGTPEKLRGQQTGFGGNPDQNRQEMDATPALRGNRKFKNKMFGDPSSQHISTDSAKPSSNSPSIPAMNTPPRCEAGGEGVFKRKLAKRRSKRSRTTG
jgi:hypothetical protein